jgi:hypothetical protein
MWPGGATITVALSGLGVRLNGVSLIHDARPDYRIISHRAHSRLLHRDYEFRSGSDSVPAGGSEEPLWCVG